MNVVIKTLTPDSQARQIYTDVDSFTYWPGDLEAVIMKAGKAICIRVSNLDSLSITKGVDDQESLDT